MAVIIDNEVRYSGAVIATKSHWWADGMLSEYAVCWDDDKKELIDVNFGYYGIDGHNLAGGICEVDATQETARKVIRYEKEKAIKAYADYAMDYRQAVKAGRQAEVIKGRKVTKGTVLDIFWVGERQTYMSKLYAYLNETEMIAGGYDKDGNKVWVKAEYLKNITKVTGPSKKERKEFISQYIKNALHGTDVLEIAKNKQAADEGRQSNGDCMF